MKQKMTIYINKIINLSKDKRIDNLSGGDFRVLELSKWTDLQRMQDELDKERITLKERERMRKRDSERARK